MIERAGQGCAIGSALFERIHQPYAREGQRTGALALRGSTRHGPGRRPVPRRPRRHRLHQQEPSRARRRTPRPRLQPQPDELRPTPPPAPRPHRAHPAPTPTPSPPTASASPSSTPSSQDRLLDPLLDADKPPAPLSFVAPLPPSTTPSSTISPMHDSGSPLETCHNVQRLGHQEDLAVRPIVPMRGCPPTPRTPNWRCRPGVRPEPGRPLTAAKPAFAR